MKTGFVLVMALLASMGGAIWWALESGEVAVIQTRSPDGTVRSTHVWYARQGGELWIEAGTPDNRWFRDVQRDPVVSLDINGRTEIHVAEPVHEPHAHTRIRSLLREKYGHRDWLIGLLVDTSHSVAVRLVPPPSGG